MSSAETLNVRVRSMTWQAEGVLSVQLTALDGGTLPPFEAGTHVDTSCLFLLFGAFHTLPRWLMMPKPMSQC